MNHAQAGSVNIEATSETEIKNQILEYYMENIYNCDNSALF